MSLIAEMIARYTPGSDAWAERGEMLSEIRKTMPSTRPLKARKTDARPLGVFDVNEGSKKGLVKVLDAIRERITLTWEEWAGKVRIILGDWLTSNNLRAARRDRVDDVNAMERIDCSCELTTAMRQLTQHPLQHIKDYSDVSGISKSPIMQLHVFFQLIYLLLNSGYAMGSNNGPS